LITIGNRKVIFSETMLCPEDERIELQAQVPNEKEPWKMEVFFTVDEVKSGGEPPKPNVRWDVEDDIWKFNFKNWNLPLGATISKPVEVAVTTSGHSIKFIAEITKINTLYRMNLQFMVEENANE